jgi:endonuclease III
MAIAEQDNTFLMDLAALLKALREERQETTQVVQQLTERLDACRDLDTKAAKALTQAVQKTTASLHQEQARMIEQSCAELQSQHKGLHQQWLGLGRAAGVQANDFAHPRAAVFVIEIYPSGV